MHAHSRGVVRKSLMLVLGIVASLIASVGSLSAPATGAGPVWVSWDAKIGDYGNSIPSLGSPVSLQTSFSVAPGDVAPSEHGLFDSMRTTASGVTPQPGPGRAGSLMDATDIGAAAGTFTFDVQTNLVANLAGSKFIPTAGALKGLVPKCGDNHGGVRTRDWNGDGALNVADDMLTISGSAIKMFVGNMAQEQAGLRPDALLANRSLPSDTGPWNVAQYGSIATPGDPSGLFIQAFDDDNANGVADAEEGSPANEPTPSGGVADPYALNNGGVYINGAPETQEDYDHDGLPNGVEYMPDVLPLYVDTLGLDPYWVARSYGIADTLHGLTPPTDVHVLSFAGVPVQGNVTITVLGNPLAPGLTNTALGSLPNSPQHSVLPGSQAGTICTPFSMVVVTDATTSAPNYGKGVVGAVTFGDDISRVTSTAAGSVDIIFSDAPDYDQDGLVGEADLCAFDGTTNADPDGDLLAGSCDPHPATPESNYVPIAGTSFSGQDLDGDGWIDDVDNCPIWPNPDQADSDHDGVGDVPACDSFVTTDTITGLPGGRGSGLPTVGLGGFDLNTSAAFDNDVICSDAYTNAENLGDPITSCTETPDANDNGIPDALDTGSDEDGDGVSDAQEVALGTNPMVPPDADGDGMSDSYEQAHSCLDPNVADGGLDPDADGLTSLAESALGTDACESDTDGDGLSDGYELGCTNPLVPDAGGDADGDGLSNGTEFAIGTFPCNSDSDGDTMPDGYEEMRGCLEPAVADGGLDPDADGLASQAELDLGTEPCVADTDADGMADGFEAAHLCLNPTIADSSGDPDGDGATNLQESQWGGDPCVAEQRYKVAVAGPMVGFVGTNHTVSVEIEQNGQPPYQAVQWKVQYDPSKVTYLGGSASAPALATFSSCTGPAHISPNVTMGCLQTAGATNFTGTGFELTFRCDTTGAASYTLIELLAPAAQTFVKIGTAAQLVSVTNATVPCQIDTDGDGMPDDFEAAHACLNVAVQDAALDPDGDTLTNGTEFNLGTDPCSADTDGDAMPDSYEAAHACLRPGVDDGSADPDADGLTSLAESAIGTDPCVADTDGDGMDDGYEVGCTDPLVMDAGGDADGDGLSNGWEFTAGTLACNGDSDGDTMPDGYEAAHSCLQPAVVDDAGDPDDDGLINKDELSLGTDPCSADTDGDGLEDGAEGAAGSDPLAADSDGDGLSDGAEVNIYGTDPIIADTDGDTLLDGAEVRNGTDPAVANPDAANPDDDGDGCVDARELGPDPLIGGQRNPLNKWDFFDVTGDHFIDLSDALDVLSFFGDPGLADTPGNLRDRDVLDPGQPWLTSEGSDGVDLTDAINSLASFGDDCSGPP